MRFEKTSLMIPLTIFILLAGCTAKDSANNRIADKTIAPDTALVLLRAKIDTPDLSSFLVSLFIDGHPAGLQGPTRGKSEKFWTAHHHINYKDADRDGAALLVWQIPQEAFGGKPLQAMVYVACISNPSDNFYYFDGYAEMKIFDRPGAMNLFPLIGKPEIRFDPGASPHSNTTAPTSDFESAVFSINSTAIYDLGTLEISGGILNTGIESSGTLRFKKLRAAFGTKISTQPAVVEEFIQTYKLTGKKVVDLSKRWDRYPIARYYSLSRPRQ